jgi:uncharacterized cupredoxin-like copper-binding protein
MKQRWQRIGLLMAISALSMALVVACGSDDDSTEPAPAGETQTQTQTEAPAAGPTTVNSILTEWAIEVDQATVPAGEVTFVVENAGVVPHELKVVRADVAHDALPVENGVVPATEYEVVALVAEFPGGRTATETFTLEAGEYILICNIPAHYQQGMHLGFTVE